MKATIFIRLTLYNHMIEDGKLPLDTTCMKKRLRLGTLNLRISYHNCPFRINRISL